MDIKSFDLSSPLLHEFISLSDSYFTDEIYVPSFKASLYQTFNEENPFFSNSKYTFFLIKDGERPIARALAFIDERRTQKEGQTIGSFGYFESPNDKEVSKLLLNSVASWLKESGATCIHGPIDLNIYNGYRLMTKGFETTPFTTEPRNPRFYESLLVDAGYEREEYWRSWEINQEEVLKFGKFVNMISTKRKNIHGLNLESIPPENLEEALHRMYEMALEVFSQNYGYSQISKKEFVSMFMGLQPFLDRDSFQLATNSQGKLVGFMYGLKDMADHFQKINGDHTRIHEVFTNQSNRYIYHTFGVIKEFRFGDMTARLTDAQISKYGNSYDSAIAALTTSNKSIVDRIKKPNREYYIFSKKL